MLIVGFKARADYAYIFFFFGGGGGVVFCANYVLLGGSGDLVSGYFIGL